MEYPFHLRTAIPTVLAVLFLLIAVFQTTELASLKRAAAAREESRTSSAALGQVPQSSVALFRRSNAAADSSNNNVLVATTTSGSNAFDGVVSSIPVQPVLFEFGAIVLCNMIGLPLLRLISVPLKRLRMIKNLRPQHLKVLRQSSSRMWKGLVAIYSRTSASKAVNRGKKVVKIWMHRDDHHHGHDDKEKH